MSGINLGLLAGDACGVATRKVKIQKRSKSRKGQNPEKSKSRKGQNPEKSKTEKSESTKFKNPDSQ